MSHNYDSLSLSEQKERLMELISIAGAGVTLYCGWVTLQDELRCWRRFRASRPQVESAKPKKVRQKAADGDRAGVAAGHWQVLLKGSA